MPHPFAHETTHSRLATHAGLGVAAAVAALALAHAAPAQAASQQRFRSGIYSDMCLTDAGVTAGRSTMSCRPMKPAAVACSPCCASAGLRQSGARISVARSARTT